MVMLYVAGQRVNWADAENFFAEAARKGPVEFRDESGRLFATSVPEPRESWEDRITPEETQRRLAQPGYSFDEVKQRLG